MRAINWSPSSSDKAKYPAKWVYARYSPRQKLLAAPLIRAVVDTTQIGRIWKRFAGIQPFR
jgi:hypothetical protein